MLSANEYYEIDHNNGSLKKRVRGPKSLKPHLTVLCDDLRGAYIKGMTIRDRSLQKDHTDYIFQCRTILLYWTGDYPAQALVSGTHSKTCHWCTHKSTPAPEISRRCWCDFRRYLPEGHHLREHASFGTPEHREAPSPRTHTQFVKDGKANQQHRGFKKDAPYHRTGVKMLSPLASLPLFNLVWDVLPDMMHIITGIWKRHIFAMFVGTRKPTRPKERSSWSKRDNDNLIRDHNTALVNLEGWILSKKEQEELDQRSMNLGGEPKWIRNNIKVCTHSSTLTSHDWMLLIQTAGHYLLAGLFETQPHKRECLLRLLDACNACLNTTSAYNSENRDVIDHVKLQVVEALCYVETYMPNTELPVMMHILLHVPDSIYRWNAVRNFWEFFNERYYCLFFLLLIYNSVFLFT